MMIAVIFGMAMSVSAQEVSESKYGTDSVACVTNLSIYGEAYKQWEAAKFAPEAISTEMVNAWREVFLNCPRSSQLIYTRGEKIMDYFIRTNPAQKDAYIDTICMMMDNRAQYFPVDPKTGKSQVAGIMGRKGLLIYTYNKNRYEEAYNVLKSAVDLDASQLQGAYIDAYFKATIDMVNNDKAEKMTIINVYQELSEVLDNNIGALATTETELETAKEEALASGDSDAVAGFDKQLEKNEKNININKGVKNNLDNLFSPFASCDDLIKVFSAKMKETPDDVTLLKRITTILDKKDCTDSNWSPAPRLPTAWVSSSSRTRSIVKQPPSSSKPRRPTTTTVSIVPTATWPCATRTWVASAEPAISQEELHRLTRPLASLTSSSPNSMPQVPHSSTMKLKRVPCIGLPSTSARRPSPSTPQSLTELTA